MSGPVIHFPTPQEEKQWLDEAIARERTVRAERQQAVEAARPALKRLCEVLCVRSGQPYKLRALMFSMWNGKPAELNEIVCFDWEIRKDLCLLLMAWGHDDMFYKQMEEAIRAVAEWQWFLEESENLETLEQWVNAAKRAMPLKTALEQFPKL